MSALTAGKTIVDSVYAYRFIRLMQKDFTEWDAYKIGIIDQNGNVIKRPTTAEEKSKYTPFHAAIRSLKKKLAVVPMVNTWVALTSGLSAIGSRFGLSESEINLIECELQPLYEDMVAGDAGGNPINIASGTTSGDIVNKGPQTLKKKYRAKRK